MKRNLALFALFFATMAQAAFVELNEVSELEDLVKTSTVPVVVQFHASWCGPCKSLISTFKKVAPSYQDTQVRLAYIDADENSSLQKYLQGGYPTVRTFINGKLAKPSFTGSQTESYVRNFIDGVKVNDERLDMEYPAGSYCPME